MALIPFNPITTTESDHTSRRTIITNDMESILVVIPCYNAAPYVAEAITSLKAQTYKNWRCVIVDDGSTDESGAIIDKLAKRDKRFCVFHTENRGVAAARNLGFSTGDGGLCLPLDADDRLVPEALEKFARAFADHPGLALAVPQIMRFGDNIKPEIQERLWRGYDHLKWVCTPTNSSCFRWADWERVDGYRHVTMYEDWEFWLRLLWRNDRVYNIPEVLVEYRVHPDSRVHEAMKHHEREIQIIRKLNPQIFR